MITTMIVLKRLLVSCASACIAVSLAGCTSSTSGSGATPTPSGTTSKAPAESELQRILLRSADLPSGWNSTPYQRSHNRGDAARQHNLVKCVGGRNTEPDKITEVHSSDFELGTARISSSVSKYKAHSDVAADVAILHSPKVSACTNRLLKAEFSGSLPGGATLRATSIRITPRSGHDPRNVVAVGTGSVKATLNGRSITIYTNVAFIVGRRLESEVDATGVGARVPASITRRMVAIVARRTANA